MLGIKIHIQIQEKLLHFYISLIKIFTFQKHLLTVLLKNSLSRKHSICSINNFET